MCGLNLKETVHNKLIRDRIPEIIIKEGEVPIIRTIKDDKEYLQLLIEKLLEEVQEFKENNSIDEIADILEVTHTIIKEMNWPLRFVESIRRKKRFERGGFSKRLFLISVKE